jgi:hypothetical protein
MLGSAASWLQSAASWLRRAWLRKAWIQRVPAVGGTRPDAGLPFATGLALATGALALALLVPVALEALGAEGAFWISEARAQSPGPPSDEPNQVPVGGVEYVVAAGGAYALYRLRNRGGEESSEGDPESEGPVP